MHRVLICSKYSIIFFNSFHNAASGDFINNQFKVEEKRNALKVEEKRNALKVEEKRNALKVGFESQKLVPVI